MAKIHKLVLVISILASFVAFMDGAIVNVALPAIQKDLGGGLAAQQWVVDAYLLTLGSLILLAGSLSDLLGRKKILWLGLVGFGIASALCAVAPTSWFLIIARGLQGAAGALLVPSSLAMIMSAFSGKEQGKAIGSWTAWTSISFVIGPLVGGLIIDNASWRWIFAINVVPIAITLWLLTKLTAKDEPVEKVHIDLEGAALCALGLGGTIFALIEQPSHGWSSPLIYGPLAVGLISLLWFIRFERRIERPMLPPGLFKNRNFSVGNIATIAIYAALTASIFLLIVYLQQVAGYSALAAGMATVPVTLILFFLSSRFGGLSAKYGPRFFMATGPIIVGIGFLLMIRINASADYVSQVLPAILVFGLGLAMTVAPLTQAILGDVEKEHAGIASAVNNAVARVAGLLAVAAIGAVVALQFNASLDNRLGNYSGTGIPAVAIAEAKTKPMNVSMPSDISDGGTFKQAVTDASVSAFHAGVAAMAGLVIVGGLISAAGIRNPKQLKNA